uniref:Uncharacterized protein n=2 Tax=Cajanus cajan TaxID=3821 RepID=A0A151R0V0_CAJCA|nr:hypothetical protein KK1_042769 [Cajanus cajan]
MEDKERVSEYITRVEKLANQLGRNGEPMPACRIVEKILRSLTDDFESIACVIEESKDLSLLSVEELVGSLNAHEQRRRKMKDTLDAFRTDVEQCFCSSGENSKIIGITWSSV